MKLKSFDVECVHQAKALLDKSPRKYITIPHLSREIGLNETKLKFAFKHLFGVGIYEYIILNRMEKGKSLLEGSDKSIKQISYELGYRTSWAFINAFRKLYDVTPAEYRRTVVMIFFLVEYFVLDYFY
jgi:two-component system response regulator YesN